MPATSTTITMPSQLTRYVFRQILANRPLVHRECPRRRTFSTILNHVEACSRPSLAPAQRTIRKPTRRTFLNLGMFSKRSSKGQEPDLDPGIDTMMDLARRQRLRARLTSPEDVVEAVSRFFIFKEKRAEGMTDTQAQLVARALRHYMESENVKPDVERSRLNLEAKLKLNEAVEALHRSRDKAADAHVALAKFLYELPVSSFGYQRRALAVYIKMLGCTHRPDDALNVMLDFEKRREMNKREHAAVTDENETHEEEERVAPTTLGEESQLSHPWASVLWAFSKQDNEKSLLSVLEQTQKKGADLEISTTYAMLDFYLRGNDLQAVRSWFFRFWALYSESFRTRQSLRPGQSWKRLHGNAGSYLLSVLKWCLAHDQLKFGHEVVRLVMSHNPAKPLWDAIFVWAAGTGKGADEINRMITVMESANQNLADSSWWRKPDIMTINTLVEYATSKNDPYLAERFLAIGKERAILPDARTYVLQMEYRLKVRDVDGALVAYTNLQSEDLSQNIDVPAVNNLLVALCDSKRHDFETVMNVAADLSDRRVRFEPSTVSSLSLLHLARDEVADAVDLLNTHSFHFSSAERKSIEDAVVAFCVDPNASIARSWNAYTVLRMIFDEMHRSQRTEIMKSFFKRERPDMAVKVFNDMRMHSRREVMPRIDTYVSAFFGSARLRDLESMELIHNQLKLDFNINIDTYLNNALMIGYTACEKPGKAIGFWEEIVSSREGPTFNSIHIALRACEKAPFGDMKAQEIWAGLRKRNIDLDSNMWASYAGALAGNGDNQLAISTLEKAEAANEVDIDPVILASLYTGSPGQAKQAEIERWARERYPSLWEEVERVGFDVDESGMRTTKIDRTVTP